jgi:transcriptional regulator with XRE-family HTH domain
VIDGALIRSRRLTLGLTRHDLSRLCGLASETLTTLEESRCFDDTYSISTVCRLARALGLQPQDLLSWPDDDVRRGDGIGTPDDVAVLGAVLAENKRGVDDESIASALGWTPGRVGAAIAELGNILEPAGLALRRVDGRTGIVAASLHLNADEREALARARRSLDPDLARVLLRLLRAGIPSRRWGRYSFAERESLMSLVAQGALNDFGNEVQPTLRLRRALSVGYDGVGHYPRGSRFSSRPPEPDLY